MSARNIRRFAVEEADRPSDLADELGWRVSAGSGAGRRGARPSDRDRLGQPVEQGLLGGEVVVHGPHGHTGSLGDLRNRDRAGALLDDQVDERAQDRSLRVASAWAFRVGLSYGLDITYESCNEYIHVATLQRNIAIHQEEP